MNSFEILDRLTVKSLTVLKDINPDLDKLDQVSVGLIVDKISKTDEKLGALVKNLNLSTKSKIKINVLELITNAYYEALLINSDRVDVHHLLFALLLKFDIEKYYVAKKEFSQNFEARIEKDANNYIEDFVLLINKDEKKVIGREKEITKLIVSLCSDENTPILLLGDSGAGKTTVVEELTRRIIQGKVPNDLKNAKVYRIKFPQLLTLINPEQPVFPSEYFSRLLVNMISRDKSIERVILFVDDLKLGVNFFIGLTPNTKDKRISVIAAAQNDLQEKFWETPIPKMWNVINLDEQSDREYKEILNLNAKFLEDTSKVRFTDESINKLVELYNNGNFADVFPGSGIKMLKALATYKQHIASTMIVDGSKALKPKKKEMMINEKDVINYIDGNQEEVDDFISKLTKEKVINLDKYLKKEIIGQEKAIDSLARSIRVASLKLHIDSRPVAVIMFLGPTGVGKTETAKALAKYVFGTKDKNKKTPMNFLRIDMTEYSEKHSVSKLFGAPPGYVGYDDSGSLVDFVKENPTSIVLFDEIDKAHPEVLTSLLHIMDEAEIRSNNGEVVSLENIIILMTSNHGADLINKQGIGFEKNKTSHEDISNKLIDNLKKQLKPEFLNRFDEIVVFEKLDSNVALKIIDLIIAPIVISLKAKGIRLKIEKDALDYICKLANFTEYGARDLKRIIKKEIIDQIAKKLLSKDADNIKSIKIALKDKKFTFEVKAKK